MHDIVRLFVANGYGFGEYWAGYIFARTTKDKYFLYLAENKMAVLSSTIDEDGEKEIVVASESFSTEELSLYFRLDENKTSLIDWLEPVNVILWCEDVAKVRNNLIYYTWPAVKLTFVPEISENTLLVYDRFVPKEKLDSFRNTAETKNLSDHVECWSMVKLLAMCDRFGELAPKICMDSIPENLKTG